MTSHEFIADLLMLAHAAYSAFIFLGVVLIVSGIILGWRWTRSRWFSVTHFAATMILVARVWIAIPCPFSFAEDHLRPDSSAPCPLGDAFHQMCHRLAFRGEDPHRFRRATTVFGMLVAGIFVLGRFNGRRTAIDARALGCLNATSRYKTG